MTQEIVSEVPTVQIQTVEKKVEVPQVQTVEHVLEVPQVQAQEVVRQVPVVQIQETVREVKRFDGSYRRGDRRGCPQIHTVEKAVEIPEIPDPPPQEEVRQLLVEKTQEVVRQAPRVRAQTVEKIVKVQQLQTVEDRHWGEQDGLRPGSYKKYRYDEIATR